MHAVSVDIACILKNSNIFANSNLCSKRLRPLNQEPRTDIFMKKTKGRKSRDTVPLRITVQLFFICKNIFTEKIRRYLYRISPILQKTSVFFIIDLPVDPSYVFLTLPQRWLHSAVQPNLSNIFVTDPKHWLGCSRHCCANMTTLSLIPSAPATFKGNVHLRKKHA
jgi:hypothetical protein